MKKRAGPGAGVLLANRWQASKVVWFNWAMIAVAIGGAFWAWDLSQTYGLSPGDGGVLRPAGERIGMALLVGGLLAAPMIGMLIYADHYAMRIVRDGDRLLITTPGFIVGRVRTYPLKKVTSVTLYDAEVRGVRAPALMIKVEGRRFPFVADMQAEHIDRAGIQALARWR